MTVWYQYYVGVAEKHTQPHPLGPRKISKLAVCWLALGVGLVFPGVAIRIQTGAMASDQRESYDNRKDWLVQQEMSAQAAGRQQSQDEAAYEYLCRLEEAKK